MKYKVILVAIIAVVCICACDYENRTNTTTNKTDKTADSPIGDLVTYDASDAINPYFLYRDNQTETMNGIFYFDEFGDISIPKKDIVFNYSLVGKYENKELYKIYIDKVQGYKIPEDRLSIGLFVVEDDKITRLSDNKMNLWNPKNKTIRDFLDSGTIPKESQVVCQDKEISDDSNKIKGWHYTLEIEGDIRSYYSCYNSGNSKGKESYYWESFVWEKNKGLVEYECGYKAGRNYYKLKKK